MLAAQEKEKSISSCPCLGGPNRAMPLRCATRFESHTPNPNRKAPSVGAGTSGIWGHRKEEQRPLHETMRLAEEYSVEEMRPKWPFWKHHAPEMRLAEAQCAHRKHCYPETPLGSHPTSRVSHPKDPTILKPLCIVNRYGDRKSLRA